MIDFVCTASFPTVQHTKNLSVPRVCFVPIHPLRPLELNSSSGSMKPFSEICLCGRSFAQLFALANHRRTCQKSKKRLSAALDKAKEAWTSRKRARSDTNVLPPPTLEISNEPCEDAEVSPYHQPHDCHTDKEVSDKS